jgi:hypothetical protein
MKNKLVNLTFEIEIQAGEKLTIHNTLADGKWLIIIQSNSITSITRSHNSFLNSYYSEDEGLYDDY